MSQLGSFDTLFEQLKVLNTSPTQQANQPQDTPSKEATATPTTSGMLPPLFFQDMEDWDKEAAEIDAQLKEDIDRTGPASKKKKSVIEPCVKKPKKMTDPEESLAERKALEEMGSSNWVAKLQSEPLSLVDFAFADLLLVFRDTRDATAAGRILDWKEDVLMNPLLRFTCSVVIKESSNVFGKENIGTTDKIVSFSDKKNAKRFAAMKAVRWLIENGFLTSDGSLPAKPIPPPQPKKTTKPQLIKTADAEEELAIRQAEQEIGSGNWIGKLQSKISTSSVGDFFFHSFFFQVTDKPSVPRYPARPRQWHRVGWRGVPKSYPSFYRHSAH